VKLTPVLPARRQVALSRVAPRSRPRRRPAGRARAPARLTDDPELPSATARKGGSPPRGITRGDAVMAEIRPGRSGDLDLTRSQRSALSDQEGLDALSILGHLIAARHAAGEDGRVPLTEQFVLWVARRLRLPVGRNGARRVVRRLKTAGVVAPAGSYRQSYGVLPRGFRVPCFRVTVAVWLGSRRLRSAPPRRRLRSATHQASNAAHHKLKSLAWWQHPLFGHPDGLPPPGTSSEVRRRWRSGKHRKAEAQRSIVFYGECGRP
jgi:hypothetical protein